MILASASVFIAHATMYKEITVYKPLSSTEHNLPNLQISKHYQLKSYKKLSHQHFS